MAAFLLLGAQAIADVPAASEQSAATGTTGAQQAAGACPEPRLTGLPPRPKFTNATIHFKLLGMTPGAVYLVKAGRSELLSGSAAGSTVKNSFLLSDQGTKSRKIPIEVIVSQDQCENSPWKLTKKIRYKAVAPPPTATPPASEPTAQTPAKPATPIPSPAAIKPPKPISTTPKLPPAGPALNIRTWMTPIDGGARLVRAPSGPTLSRIERKADKANSSAALVGLAALFIVVSAITIGGLWALKRRDDAKLEEALDILPQHLDEGDPDIIRADEDPATASLAAQAIAGRVTPVPAPSPAEPPAAEPPAAEPKPAQQPAAEPTTAEQPVAGPKPAEQTMAEQPAAEPKPEQPAAEPTPPEQPVAGPAPPHAEPALVEENGSALSSPTHHRAQVEAELQRMLDEVGVSAELEGILADAKAEAERQGISIDSDLMLQALCDELNGAGTLSEPARTELRSKFQEIIAEEAERVPQQTS